MSTPGMSLSAWQAVRQDLLSVLHCALPGTVESFDAETQAAVVRPGVKGMPLLRDVPVFMPVFFEINPGDPCLLVFADRDTEAWAETGRAEEPASGRMHSLSDAFAFVGFKTGRGKGGQEDDSEAG